MFTVGTVTIVAFVFRDGDLIHNLMGIAPFADLGCTATFTAKQFTLTHLGKDPILIGTRHTSNLWRIPIPRHAPCPTPDYGANQVTLLHQTATPEAEHIRFVHASLGHPTPTTFLNAVARFVQFPRLTTKNVRRHMPNSEASARGHLRKTPTAQPHAESNAVSALQRFHKAQVLKAHHSIPPPLPNPRRSIWITQGRGRNADLWVLPIWKSQRGDRIFISTR
jgi:hypothetical protein